MAKKGLNIYKRKDGRYEGRYKSGYTTDGRIRYASVYGKSYSAVKDILERKRAEAYGNTDISCTLTVGELVKIWLTDVKNKVKISTLANYTMKLEKHILPYFSGIRYDKLTAENLNTFITKKINEKLSERYVADIVVLIKSVARFAQRRYGVVNRLEYVTLPMAQDKTEKRLLTVTEQERLKAEMLKNPTKSNVGILLTFATGLRIGELCALRWENINLEKRFIAVKTTVQRIWNCGKGTQLIITAPKSSKSIREIPLPDFIIPYLKNIKAADECFLLSGSTKIIEPRTMQYRFKSLLKKADLPYVNFHTLRHMFATKCIALGFDVKTLSEILGHSSVELTLNRYVHSSMERKQSCMKIFSDSFGAA